MKKQSFKPHEASRMLPLVKKIVLDILERGQKLRAIVEALKGAAVPAEAEALQAEIEILMNELEMLGCYYKDWNFEIGLVDFPSSIDGKEVFLCWRSDEPSLSFYHGIDEGYPGRKKIPEHLLS